MAAWRLGAVLPKLWRWSRSGAGQLGQAARIEGTCFRNEPCSASSAASARLPSALGWRKRNRRRLNITRRRGCPMAANTERKFGVARMARKIVRGPIMKPIPARQRLSGKPAERYAGTSMGRSAVRAHPTRRPRKLNLDPRRCRPGDWGRGEGANPKRSLLWHRSWPLPRRRPSPPPPLLRRRPRRRTRARQRRSDPLRARPIGPRSSGPINRNGGMGARGVAAGEVAKS
jgi:hypothetical protein